MYRDHRAASTRDPRRLHRKRLPYDFATTSDEVEPLTRRTIAIASIALFSWLGCGADEEPLRPRIVKPEASRPQLAEMSADERKRATEYQDELGPKFFDWPAGTPGERDAVTDMRGCREQALDTDDYLRASELVRFLILSECMTARGWKIDEAAVRAHATAAE
jgi:hypothetical protein